METAEADKSSMRHASRSAKNVNFCELFPSDSSSVAFAFAHRRHRRIANNDAHNSSVAF